MSVSPHLLQAPHPGHRLLMFQGDTLTFSLSLPAPAQGAAALRTNLGHAPLIRKEIIDAVDANRPSLAEDWFDMPMRPVSETVYRITLPLCQVGHFEAKCYFLPEGAPDPVWPEGPNTEINVEPADTCCGNIIYNAFVRQFGPGMESRRDDPEETAAMRHLDRKGFTVIPPSGTFRELIRHLDFILGELGCRVLQLLPIHPTPTTYGRMGRFGSPYAALGFTEVDPSLAEFDPKATPVEQFLELVDAVHARGAKLLIDIAINHTGWAARIHETHPEWLVRGEDGRIEVPGAWGVRWEDLTRLDYRYTGLWQYMADMFLVWCRRGVDGFRCDAGYMIPVAAWRYIIARVRDEFPDTLFNLEGLGGKISVTRDILNRANMNWGYSELFQNYDRGQIEYYLPEAWQIAATDGIMVHFAETHDNNRLAATSKTYARMRTGLCALFSHNGAFAFANGVEWFATEKINVHEAGSLNWGASENQVAYLSKIHAVLKQHPAFHDGTELSMLQEGEGNFLVLHRRHPPTGKALLVVVNLSETHPARARWRDPGAPLSGDRFTDLISEGEVRVDRNGPYRELSLSPGAVLCLSPTAGDLALCRPDPSRLFAPPPEVLRRRLRAKALEAWQWASGMGDLSGFDPDRSAIAMEEDPAGFCTGLHPENPAPPVTVWRWPQDLHREVMLPPGNFLLVLAPSGFRARITREGRTLCAESAIERENAPEMERHFALFLPLPAAGSSQRMKLLLTVYENGGSRRMKAPLRLLKSAREDEAIRLSWRRSDPATPRPNLMLATNGIGGMLRAPVSWGQLTSRYDALLAANLNPDCPEDRWVMLSRCRGWVVFQGYSLEINADCLDRFAMVDHGQGLWRFKMPTGQGEHILFSIGVYMVRGANAMGILFHRHEGGRGRNRLPDQVPVRLILRPDIEDRNFHHTVKASQGPERDWPGCVLQEADGFTFSPHEWRHLRLRLEGGRYHPDPEWRYMVHRPLEAERGLDPHSDLFSPGYFSVSLEGGDTVHLTASVSAPSGFSIEPPEALDTAIGRRSMARVEAPRPLFQWLGGELDHFIVKRGAFESVIAGYPWFLDWGRDSLIVVRGLVALGRFSQARNILKQFGQFEEKGTLPNMIHGQDARNRETSDAPLWFMVACRDLLEAEKSPDFLEERCGNRTVRDVLFSIGTCLMAGLDNGVRMDPETGLIFSPAHFTWMDTNHPAGSPRQGYPVEIQALWHAALVFLSQIDGKRKKKWEGLAGKVREMVKALFYLENAGYLSDCLHCEPGVSARQALPDDALRPNQLFTLTLQTLTDKKMARAILAACEGLLVPGGIRSLADQPVQPPLAVWHHGRLLNDPHRPYAGRYAGDEDTSRKPAYHNGTAWTWPFPSFCEAWITVYGETAKAQARAWLASAVERIQSGCIGQLPEVLDGDAPHEQRGCDAQAWGVSELVRVWRMAQS